MKKICALVFGNRSSKDNERADQRSADHSAPLTTPGDLREPRFYVVDVGNYA